jgi:hypothetical protein
MGQSRNKTGIEFEKLVCETYGWKHASANPRIRWSGQGRSNWDKIKSVNFDPSLFKPDMDKSRFEKYDAINNTGEKVEIKKYTTETLSDWCLYSEPIFKIATRQQMKDIIRIFGDGDYEQSVVKYNKFVEGITEHVGPMIIRRIYGTSIGVQLIDKFIPKCDLEFKWVVIKSWKGYNRLSIYFRIKTTEVLP